MNHDAPLASRVIQLDPVRLPMATALAFSLAAAALYAFTAAPHLTLVDSGELALAATTLTPAHPPGFPAFVWIGWLFTRLPIGEAVRELNLLSALLTASSVAFVYLAADRLQVLLEAPGAIEADTASPRAPISALAALAWMTGRNPWSWSGLTEVYALNNALLAGALFCGFHWAAGARFGARPETAAASAPLKPKRRDRVRTRRAPAPCGLPIVAFALAALGLANHHVTAAPALPALVLLGLLTSPRVFLQRRFIVAAAIGLVALVALYASLIPLADRSAGLNWGGLDGPGPLFKHVVGSQYQSFLEEEGESVGRVASQIARGLLLDCSPIVALLAIAAIALARSRSSRASSIAWAPLLLLLATNVALSLIYIAGPEDRLAYDLPAHMSLCLLGAVGWRLLARRWARAVASPVAAALLVVALAFNVARNGRHCNLRQERVAQTLVREVLEPIPPGGLVITAEWNLMAPFLYMNRVEGYRTDARVIDVLLLRRTWYLHFLRREYPDLAAAGGAAFETFIEEATRFNRGEPYDVERINRAYADTMALWVRWGMERGGAYVDLPTIRQPQERQWLDRFDAQPEELLFRLSEIGVEPPAREMTPKDARNLAYVFAKAQRDGVIGDPLLIEPRNVQYWKVFGLYQSAVRASLVQIGANRGEEAARRVAERYRAWHPTIDADLDSAIETARRAAPLLPPPQSPPPPSQSTPPPSPAAPIVTRPVRKSR